jgi:hypothetical protein
VTPDAEGLKTLKKLGIADRLRDPKDGDERTERFISFRHKELKKDGTKADPIRIVDSGNSPWGDGLIGNGSTVDVKFVVRDYGTGRKKGVYIRALRVLDLVPYVAQEFAPLESDDEFFSEQVSDDLRLPDGLEPVVEDDLNDDIP